MSCTLFAFMFICGFFNPTSLHYRFLYRKTPPLNYEKKSYILSYMERTRSASKTAVSGSFFGASLAFHATTNRTDADFTL
jgi:hypothetical protein